MEDNIYNAPKSNIKIEEDYKGSPVKGILLATAIDVFGSIVVGIISTVIYGRYLASQGYDLEGITQQLENIDSLSLLSVVSTAFACVITIYAGYFCAKKINYSEYKFVLIFCFISAFSGFLIGGAYFSITENIVYSLMTIACGLVGAKIYITKKCK